MGDGHFHDVVPGGFPHWAVNFFRYSHPFGFDSFFSPNVWIVNPGTDQGLVDALFLGGCEAVQLDEVTTWIRYLR